MNTAPPSPNDPAKNKNVSPHEVAGPKVGLGSTPHVAAIRDPNAAPVQAGSGSRSGSSRNARDDADDASKDKIASAMNIVVDALEVIVREVPRGAQAQLSPVKEQLVKAREAVKAFCDTKRSNERSAQGADDRNAPRSDDERSTQRMDSEGSRTGKGSPTARS